MNYLRILLRICFLSVVIYSFTISTIFSQNLTKNPGFETGVFSPYWSTYTVNGISSVKIDINEVYSGDFSANLTGINTYLYQPFNFEPNTTYTLKATIKTESGETVKLGAKDFGGSEVSIVFDSTNYKTNSITFTTNEIPGSKPQIYIWKPAGSGSIWVDDIELTANTMGQTPDEAGGLGTYYISPLGNNNNSGTSPEEAWQTIDKVNLINFEPGDTILFEGGETFIGNIRFNYNDTGTSDNILHLGSYGTGMAIIDAGTGPGLTVSDCEYLSIKNLNIIGDGRKNGNTGNGITFSYCSNIVVDNVEVSGFQHSGLTAKDLGENYRFTNVYAHENGFAGIFIAGPDRTSLSNIYVGYCVTDNNPGDPTVLTNHSGSGILAYNAKNITIEYCKASNNGWDMPRIGNGPGGIWVTEVDSVIIQYCISYENKTPAGAKDGVGFDLDGGTTNSIIQYCLSYNNHGAGYGVFQYNGASNWGNNVIRYCISENDGNVSGTGSVILWNGSRISNEFQGFEFYNNVIYNTNGQAMDFLDHYNSNFNFRNNIFVSKSGKVYDGIDGENIQGNCWYSLNNNYYYQDSVDFITWAQANNQEILNDEIVGMYTNPMLINPGYSTFTDPTQLSSVNDYKVAEGSKVVDAGLDLESLFNINPGTQDYFGNLVKQGMAFDIGVYQNIDKQKISFFTGWNIMSLNVMPNDSNLMNILQPLIDAGKLKKVMDETGKVIEDWGSFGGWQNTIGNLRNTEGYKINVTSAETLNVTGIPTQVPLNIPLNTGWNIISWPLSDEQDGKEVFQALIDGGYLKKVMNEKGEVIENWGSFGGWQNTIGNFKPGEGYKVNVTSACTLTINETGTKSEVIIPELIASTHFIPAYKGNGNEHMNVNLINLVGAGIMEGDEIGIFDGNICVGSARIQNHPPIANGKLIVNQNSLSIPVSSSDGINGKNGYTEGNSITLKLFRNGSEYPLTLQPLNQSDAVFKKGSSLFAQVDLVKGLAGFPGSNGNEINCYPNPFSDEITLEINLSIDSEVSLEILNQLGQRVNILTTERMLNSGTHRLKWNGKNTADQKVSSGIYYVRIMIGSEINFKKVVYSKID